MITGIPKVTREELQPNLTYVVRRRNAVETIFGDYVGGHDESPTIGQAFDFSASNWNDDYTRWGYTRWSDVEIYGPIDFQK